jgi:YD repeat-containing protein
LTGAWCTVCGVSNPTDAKPDQWRGLKAVLTGLAIYFVLVSLLVVFAFHFVMKRMKEREAWARAHPSAMRQFQQPAPVPHQGPVARVEDLNGSGRICLIQIGPHSAPYSLNDLAQWLQSKYGLDVQVLPATDLDHAALDLSRAQDFRGANYQYVAELLYAQMKRTHPDLAADPNVYLIGITEADMYSMYYKWRTTFSQRDGQRAAILSANGLQDAPWKLRSESAEEANRHFQARLRRILLKDVAVLYWHLPLNNDPTSLLQQPLYPDILAEDIYQSDLDPARTKSGENISAPCILLEYSAKDGVKPHTESPIQECSSRVPSRDDESLEMFQVDLGTGLLIDRHTDFYLPDTIPIRFERVTRDGWSGSHPFGLSGTDSYDDFLESADNITITVIHADGGREDMVRVPRWLPLLGMVKYVDTSHSGKFYEMRWHGSPFEHYEMKRYDGEVKSYLPCDSPRVLCSLTDDRDAQGRELKFERDDNRKLVRLTSPNNSWLSVIHGAGGAIAEIDDSRGRRVLYGYDLRNRLVSVTYPSGEVFHYEYDGTQHLLTFSETSDALSEPRVLLRNEYENGRISRQTLADGAVYAYRYELAKDGSIVTANLDTPDKRSFMVGFARESATVHEQTGQHDAGSSQAAPR